jgi:AcrR family transcriptional regulator
MRAGGVANGQPVGASSRGEANSSWQDEGMSDTETGAATEPKLRADARRNRARILAVAGEAFGSEGLSVPVQEIARRAGVGTGTVSRHFPTKESLFEAILLSRARQLTAEATQLLEEVDPGAAFFGFFTRLIAEGAANLGLAEALTGAGYDLDEAVGRDGVDPMRALARLLTRAQAAGAIRPDVDAADVKALIGGCLARAAAAPDGAALDRMVSIARQGLENRP